MGTATEAEQNADRLQISLPERPRELRLWLIDQVTILAEAKGEELTEQRLRIYVEDLSDLTRPQLEPAFVRARRELKFFPQISELRELAGAMPEDARKVEVDAAWNYVLDYLRKWGVDRMPLYSGGKRIDPPALPHRIEYALRRIGGLWALNQITAESRPFMQKDFAEAYQQAPVAESLAPRLESMFGDKRLLGQVKQLTSGARMEATARSSEQASKVAPPTIKRVTEPPSPEQMRDRASVQKQALADWQARRHRGPGVVDHSLGDRQ
jgi:hypothetical protein